MFDPILSKAVESNFLDIVPTTFDLIDTIHLLPARKGKTPAIQVRFRSRMFKEAIMRNKKKFFEESENPSGAPSIVDDITKKNADLLKATKNRDDVQSAWFFSGRVRYKLKSNPDKIEIAKLAHS